jgi:hypothetical protein
LPHVLRAGERRQWPPADALPLTVQQCLHRTNP